MEIQREIQIQIQMEVQRKIKNKSSSFHDLSYVGIALGSTGRGVNQVGTSVIAVHLPEYNKLAKFDRCNSWAE